MLRTVAGKLAAASGLATDQARFVTCMLFAYPLALLFAHLLPPVTLSSDTEKKNEDFAARRAARATLRHVVGALLGALVIWEFMYAALWHVAVNSLVCYALVRFLPRHTQHRYVFLFAMGYMSCIHVYRMYTGYLEYKLDFSGPMMMLTIKMITFSFDYKDGLLAAKAGKPTQIGSGGNSPLRRSGDRSPGSGSSKTLLPVMNSHQRAMHLTELPSILEFVGYVFNFCGLLSGPAINFREYRNWIDGSVFDDAPRGEHPNTSVRKLVLGLKQLGIAFFSAAVLQVSGSYFPLDFVLDPAFAELNFAVRAFYLCFATALTRWSYYFAWYLSEGACIWSGLGYSNWDSVKKKAVFKRASNVNLIKIETAQNFHAVTSNWNIRTNDWLKYYVAFRVPRKYSVQVTTMTSAFWHGFYPGYYLSFLTASFCIEGARLIRSRVRTLFVTYEEGANGEWIEKPKATKGIYDILCMFGTFIALNYVMSAFMFLGWDRAISAWTSVYFWFHFVIVIGLIALKSPLPWGRGPPRKKTA